MTKQLTLFILFITFSSCSFNKLFLAPDKIPADAKRAKLINHETGDTLFLNIGEKFQPTFTNFQNDTINLGYQIESVLFETAIKNTLNGWIVSPNSDYNGITLLFLHGNAGNVTSQYPGIIPLVKKGFRFFVIDYSGFGFSEGKATRKNVLLDANAALDYIISRKDLQRDKLLIYGQSLGGHLAATVGAENQDKIDGLIIEGAFSSHKDIGAAFAGFFGRLLVAEMYSATKSIQVYKKPVLVIHSTEDEMIPFKMGKKIFEHANEPKTFYEIAKCHICGPVYYTDSIATKILELTK